MGFTSFGAGVSREPLLENDNNINAEQVKKVAEQEASIVRSMFHDSIEITKDGSRMPNFLSFLSACDAGRMLDEAGFQSEISRDGKAVVFSGEDAKCSIRGDGGIGGASLDFSSISQGKKLLFKVRLDGVEEK